MLVLLLEVHVDSFCLSKSIRLIYYSWSSITILVAYHLYHFVVPAILTISRASTICLYWCLGALKHCLTNLESPKSPPEETINKSSSSFFQNELCGTLGNTRSKYEIKFAFHMSLKLSYRASLVAQWLRICLPMQGARVRALVWEDPTCRGAAGPVSHNYWACASGACAPQQERPR